MSVLYPLIQALVLFAVAPLLSGVTRVARRAFAQSPRSGRFAGIPRHYQTAGPSEHCACGFQLGLPPDAVCDGGRDADYRHCATGSDRWLTAAATGRSDHLNLPVRHCPFFFSIAGLDTGSPFTAIGASREGDARRAG